MIHTVLYNFDFVILARSPFTAFT